MDSLSAEEKFILNQLKKTGDSHSLSYKKLQDLCADEFEGLRLILKKMKSKELVDFEGMIPGYNSTIHLRTIE